VDDHEVRLWDVQQPAHGGAVGILACSCGWQATLGPFDNLVDADHAAHGAWAGHIEAGPLGF
jgi:hypothetical protein